VLEGEKREEEEEAEEGVGGWVVEGRRKAEEGAPLSHPPLPSSSGV